MLKEIFDRRSVRQFTQEAVTREQLTELLRAAMNAPTAVNKQEWRFTVLTTREQMDQICQYQPYTKMMLQAQAAIIVSAELDAAQAEGFAYLDCGAAIENLLLEAVHQGLGTCWCGLAPMEEPAKAIQNAYNIPECHLPMGVIAIGHPASVTPRVDQYDEGKVTWL